MKSTSKIFAMMAAVGLMAGFSSCNGDDETVDNNQPQAVRFSADIAAAAHGEPQTRAAGTIWANGDAIGIFMVKNGATTIAEGATNKQFITTGTSEFTAGTDNEIYYPMDGSAVDFIAYYPYAAGKAITDNLSVDVSGAQTATSQADYDLLWAKADNSSAGYDKGNHKNTAVALEFDHKLAKIVMNAKAETNTGISDFSGATVTINGMKTETTFKLEDGTLAAAATQATITPRKLASPAAGCLASYDAIIIPADYNADDVTVDFTVNGETYTWKLGADTFASGNEYTYAVTLTRTGVSIEGTINPWIAGPINDRGGVTAE